jgi:hypothetical protein
MDDRSRKAEKETMDKEYLTVKEFAAAAGVSTQRIYQRLAKDLQSYCKQENGVILISVEGLTAPLAKPLQSDLPSTCKELAKDLQPAPNQGLAHTEGETLAKDLQSPCKEETPGEIVSLLQSTLDLLQQQLTEKDKQISSLDEQIKTKDKLIGDLTERLTAAQALHAGTLREHLETAPEARQSRGADEDNTGGAAAADQSTEGDQAPLPEKKSLFQRIFGRKRRF